MVHAIKTTYRWTNVIYKATNWQAACVSIQLSKTFDIVLPKNLIHVFFRIRTEVILSFLNPRGFVSSLRDLLFDHRHRHQHPHHRHHHHHFMPIIRFSQQTNLNISRTWFLFNLVTTHVLHLWSLLLAHLPAPLWTSLIALFGLLHLVMKRTPHWSSRASSDSLLHFHLSLMAVHHLHHLHYHHLHLLLLVQSFILNLGHGSSANPFLHRPFSFSTGLIPWTLWPSNVFILLSGWICLHGVLH